MIDESQKRQKTLYGKNRFTPDVTLKWELDLKIFFWHWTRYKVSIITAQLLKKRAHISNHKLTEHKNSKHKNLTTVESFWKRTIYCNPKKVQCCHDRKTFRELSTRYLEPPAMVSYEKSQISTSFADFLFRKKPNLVTIHFIHMITLSSWERKTRLRDWKKHFPWKVEWIQKLFRQNHNKTKRQLTRPFPVICRIEK